MRRTAESRFGRDVSLFHLVTWVHLCLVGFVGLVVVEFVAVGFCWIGLRPGFFAWHLPRANRASFSRPQTFRWPSEPWSARHELKKNVAFKQHPRKKIYFFSCLHDSEQSDTAISLSHAASRQKKCFFFFACSSASKVPVNLSSHVVVCSYVCCMIQSETLFFALSSRRCCVWDVKRFWSYAVLCFLFAKLSPRTLFVSVAFWYWNVVRSWFVDLLLVFDTLKNWIWKENMSRNHIQKLCCTLKTKKYVKWKVMLKTRFDWRGILLWKHFCCGNNFCSKI